MESEFQKKMYHSLKSFAVRIQYAAEDHREEEIDQEQLKKELEEIADQILILSRTL